MTEQNTTEEITTEGVEVTTEATGEEKVEVSWDQVLPVVKKVLEKNETVAAFGRLLIEAESKKDALKERILSENKELQSLLTDLRTEMDVTDPSWELDLPQAEGQPGFFVKKD